VTEPFGWVGKILRVDLNERQITSEDTLKYGLEYIGGRGINARIAWNEIPPDIGPYDPDNKLMFMTGPLTGTLASGSGRLTVGGVAPQVGPTPRYSRSGMGGHLGPELKYAGFDGVVFQGRADHPMYLWIRDEEVELLDASTLWGLDTYATIQQIMALHGKHVQVACIGPAGENTSRIAIIQSDSESAAGQGGFGGVMGSKNLKAIAVRGTNGIRIAKPREFYQLCKEVGNEMCASSCGLKPRLDFSNPPTGPHVHVKACSMGCLSHCSATVRMGVPGKYYARNNTTMVHCAGFNAPSEEEQIEARVTASRLGLNIWEVSYGIMPWLVMCRNEGLITDIAGIPIPPTRNTPVSSELWCTLMELIASKKGIGASLSEGVCRASKALFNGAGQRFLVQMYPGAPQRPIGQTGHWNGHYGAVGPRWPHWLVSALLWMTDTRDPASDSVHHFSDNIEFWPKAYGGVVPWSNVLQIAARMYGTTGAFDPDVTYDPPAAKAIPAIWHGNRGCVLSSLLVCEWTFPRIFSSYTPDHFGDTSLESKLYSAATGIAVSERELDAMGERIFNLERAIEVRYGRTRAWDEAIIPYFALPDSKKNVGVDREKFHRMIDEYYLLRGWEKDTGIPTQHKLREQGLNDVADALESA
jgi:aldehyde:ferredoxin oxidoreductase